MNSSKRTARVYLSPMGDSTQIGLHDALNDGWVVDRAEAVAGRGNVCKLDAKNEWRLVWILNLKE